MRTKNHMLGVRSLNLGGRNQAQYLPTCDSHNLSAKSEAIRNNDSYDREDVSLPIFKQEHTLARALSWAHRCKFPLLRY